MSQRVTVQFPADRDNDFYFRVFCWADDTLYPAIDMKGLGVIYDLDRVRETVRIDVHKRQHLGQVIGLLKKTLPQHFPSGEGTIVRGDPAAGQPHAAMDRPRVEQSAKMKDGRRDAGH